MFETKLPMTDPAREMTDLPSVLLTCTPNMRGDEYQGAVSDRILCECHSTARQGLSETRRTFRTGLRLEADAERRSVLRRARPSSPARPS